MKVGPVPRLEIAREIEIQTAVRGLIRDGLVKSAHDCSEGGLAVALAECCFNPEKLFGATAVLATELAATTALFNESQSRIIISVAANEAERTTSLLQERAVPMQLLGHVGEAELHLRLNNETLRWPIADLYDNWWNAIRRAVERD